MNYTHLTQAERYQIYALKKVGQTQKQIAMVLNRSESTISRELRRNAGKRGYRAKQAQSKAKERRACNVRRVEDSAWLFAHSKLLEQWSPEQISGHVAISVETIYQRVYRDEEAGGLLWKNLRCQKKVKKRYGKMERRGSIPNRQFIEDRPTIVEERSRVGGWEADTIIGKNHRQAIVSIVERKTEFTLIHKAERKTANDVGKAMNELLKLFQQMF